MCESIRPAEEYVCPYCNKLFPSKKELDAHERKSITKGKKGQDGNWICAKATG